VLPPKFAKHSVKVSKGCDPSTSSTKPRPAKARRAVSSSRSRRKGGGCRGILLSDVPRARAPARLGSRSRGMSLPLCTARRSVAEAPFGAIQHRDAARHYAAAGAAEMANGHSMGRFRPQNSR
jgi:hypothetical protein